MKYFKLFYPVVLIFLIFHPDAIAKEPSPVLNSSRQAVLVLTDSLKATSGRLYLFRRDSTNSEWQYDHKSISVSLGRSGLGAGMGLHSPEKLSGLPAKSEGDGRSPAGIFHLSSVFGYQPAEKMAPLKMPYIHVTEVIECIDDPSSAYYNQILSKNQVDKFDWKSSEKMSRAGIYYEQGVVVEHNTNPAIKGSGSCIFLHNWARPSETTAGCTVMDPANMKFLINWLDHTKTPVLIQLTKPLHAEFKALWGLPQINTLPDGL